MPDNKATMLRIFEVFSQDDLGPLDELLAEDFVEHEELPPGIPQGREAPRTLMTMMRGAFPDFRAVVEELLQDGDKVVARVRFSGTHQGEFMGIPATGKRFDIAVIDIMGTLRNGSSEFGRLFSGKIHLPVSGNQRCTFWHVSISNS